MHSHGISAHILGLKAWKRQLQACPGLGCMEFSLWEEFCRREGQDTRRGQGKARDRPLCLALSCFYSLKKHPKPTIISSPPAQSCSKESSTRVLAISGFVSKTSPDLQSQGHGKIPNLSEIGFHWWLEDLQPPSTGAWKGLLGQQ